MFNAIIQDSIFRPGTDYNSGETLFVHTTLELLPYDNGVSIGNPSYNQTDSVNFAFQLTATDTPCTLSRLRLVTFVQDMNTLQILQSAEAPIVPYNLATPYIPIINGDSIYCSGGYTTLSVVNVFPGASYYWSNGDTGVAVNVGSTGYYTVTAVNNFGSAVSDSFYVVMHGAPDQPLITGDTFICGYYGTWLAVSNYYNYYNYYWEINSNYNGPDQNPTYSYVDSVANYTLVVGNKCGVDSASFSVTTNWPLLTYPNVGGGSIACSRHPIKLYVENPCTGCTYLWDDSILSDTLNVSSAGNYKLIATAHCGQEDSIGYKVYGAQSALTITGDTIACTNNGDALITVNNITPGSTFLYNGDTVSTHFNNYNGSYSVGVVFAGYYYFQASNVCGTSGVDSVFIYGQPDNPILNYMGTFCYGQKDTITITNYIPQYSYQWWPDATRGPQSFATYTGYYTVTVVNPFCYTQSAEGDAWITASSFPQEPVIEGNPYLCYGSDYLSISYPESNINYHWNTGSSQTYIYADTPGAYYIIASNLCGADTSFSFIVLSPDTGLFNAAICSGDTYNFYGDEETVAGTYTRNFYNVNGCDSAVVVLFLTVDSPDSTSLNVTICTNESYRFFGTNETATGTYSHTLQNVIGCDSTVILYLTVNLVDSTSLSATICANESYPFFGTNETTTGTYSHTLQNVNVCDSIVTLHLTVNLVDSTSLSATICANESYPFFGTNETTAGTYSHSLQNVNGCDSIITLHLTFNPVDSTSLNATICPNESYPFFGTNETTTGTYSHSLQNVNGCDSIITLFLTVNPVDSTSFNATICSNENYSFFGMSETATGTFSYSLQNVNGCDSIITLHLTVNPVDSTSLNATICPNESYPFFGINETATGTYGYSLQNVNGCDSIITLYLTVNRADSTSFNATICSNENYSFFGMNETATGIYSHSLQNINGCDSVVTVNLTVYEAGSYPLQASICEGEVFSLGGHIISTSGQFIDTLQNVNGCDSILVLDLQVNGPDTVLLVGNDTLMLNGSDPVQWINCSTGQLVTGAMSNYFIPDSIGSYAAIITYGNCIDTSTCFSIIPTDISQVKEENDGVSIYPNPSTGRWHLVAAKGLIGAAIDVFDEQGQQVFHSIIREQQSAIELQVSSGVYYLQLSNSEVSVVKKIIKF